ncbi:hypothetical protein [Pseudomonas aeruginosa]|uniref:hypothetical protein n=1 Tax=Pseudomonas aeruginosa TaxID=287 RepID=UPI00190F6E71|nr:hypothetical protein [Pseudomonas aeruginosa]
MSMELNKANECTCPSGDGSLVHPCPAHPAVEQAGANVGHGHVFPRADGVKMRCGGPGLCSECTADASRARAALAQPSPALPPFAEKVLAKLRRFYDCASDFESGGVDIGRHWLDLLTQLGLLNRVQRSPALWEISQQGEDLLGMPQPSPAQAEAERPEVVAYLFVKPDGTLSMDAVRHKPSQPAVSVMTVAQHERIVEARWNRAMDLLLDHVSRISEKLKAERDAALARVAELEMLLRKLSTNGLMQFSTVDEEMAVQAALGGAPVSQAQQLHDLDKQCRDDVARALGLRPSQERGFAWSYLLTSIKSCVKASEDSAQAQHSVPDGAADLCRFLAKLYCELDGLRYSTAKLPAEQIADALIFKWPVLQGARNQLNIKRISEQPYDESKLHSAIAAMLAAAPGKEGV